nr:PREDICTED: probable galacturonosyltransferase 3 [Daucus carota subsp. sativus]XP_017237095.1 PREDICTED: probable galacturonosyltransferase 3 [Daucus carota subsp. sativus]XP_017237096.1 PREDICTED: probable galacturonosyltransferase 3 [Daucus carota subsp. sativus]
MNAAAAEQARTLDTTVMGRYSIWRTKYENPNSDSTLKVSSVPNLSIIHVGLCFLYIFCSLLSALDRAKEMGHILALAKDQLYDCIEVARTLRAMLQMKETNVLEMKKKSAFLTQLAAKTVPRPLHCLPLLLATDYLLHCLPLKILFLNDDIVVQKDLTPLWSVDLKGMVNGAIEACKESFHRLDKYLSFSNPNIYENFDPNACGWAFGMNMFDLKEWRLRNITGIYRRSQDMVTE